MTQLRDKNCIVRTHPGQSGLTGTHTVPSWTLTITRRSLWSWKMSTSHINDCNQMNSYRPIMVQSSLDAQLMPHQLIPIVSPQSKAQLYNSEVRWNRISWRIVVVDDDSSDWNLATIGHAFLSGNLSESWPKASSIETKSSDWETPFSILPLSSQISNYE